MANSKQTFQSKLPARITGLVFWGLVFIGLLGAVFSLNNAAVNLTAKNKSNVLQLAHEIEAVLEYHYSSPVTNVSSGRIRYAITKLRREMDFVAVVISIDEFQTAVGIIKDEYTKYNAVAQFYLKDSTVLNEVEIVVYYKNEEQSIADLRKNTLLIVGFSVFIFGLILQKILNALISKPFSDMVDTAEKISAGQSSIRFNEERQDEFGYLGSFINQAISKLVKKQNDLNEALTRAEISEEELNTEKERAIVTLTSITDAVITVNLEGVIRFINPSASKLLGVKESDVVNTQFHDVVNITNEITGEPLSNILAESFSSGDVFEVPEHSSLINNDSVAIAIEASVAGMRNHFGDLMGAVIVIQDVSHTRKLTKQLSYQASHDMLTGLYNRRKFEEILNEILLNTKKDNKQHTFCYLDLDQFKVVNDTCGHVAGDELLRQIPELFHMVLRSGDIVARLGGDEFGILLENCNVAQAKIIADKIREKISNYRFNWDDKVFTIGVSVGLVGISNLNADLAVIMSTADIACYAAKDSGRNRVHVYEHDDDAMALRHGEMHWTSKIQYALDNNQFRLYKQPIVNIAGESAEHFEILIRMKSEDDEVIPPGAFLPAAERYNLMNSIDRWVIKETFKFMAADNPADPIMGTEKVISINLSGDSVNDDSMLEYIKDQQVKTGIDFINVCFEITETVAISNLTKASKFMKSLKQYGCRFSLDDFGSGLSSFAYLKTLPVDYLKIDGSFVQELCNDEIDRAMVASIHQIGGVMSLKTIAEKVENEETLIALREIGVDYVQGYHLGRPESIYAE